MVTPEWVEKSKEAGHVLPVDEFRPSERPLLSSTQISGINPRSKLQFTRAFRQNYQQSLSIVYHFQCHSIQ